MAQIEISSLEELNRLGSLLASGLLKFNLPPLFLRGELGSGKTALVRAIVEKMEASEAAETGSPSFNIYNLYPTIPPVFHCDLYKCGNRPPEELLEALERGEEQVMLEWADFFPQEKCPENFLDISFNMIEDIRLLTLTANGGEAEALLAFLLSSWR